MQIKLFLLFCEKKINKIGIPRVTSRALGSLVCLETSIEVARSLFFSHISRSIFEKFPRKLGVDLVDFSLDFTRLAL